MSQANFKLVIQVKQAITKLWIYFTVSELSTLAMFHVNKNVHNEPAGSVPKDQCYEAGMLWKLYSISWEGRTLITVHIVRIYFVIRWYSIAGEGSYPLA